MFVVYLAGGIASGKSTVAQELERRGAWRIDLDQLSREVLEPGSSTLTRIAEAFGDDLLDEKTGELKRSLLAERAFTTPEATALLEQIELPAIRERLIAALTNECCASQEPPLCVVEVPLLDRMEELLSLADEIVCVYCPAELRLERALGRGMNQADVLARMERQTSDEWLRAHADTVFENDGTLDELLDQMTCWWAAHEQVDWASRPAEEVSDDAS